MSAEVLFRGELNTGLASTLMSREANLERQRSGSEKSPVYLFARMLMGEGRAGIVRALSSFSAAPNAVSEKDILRNLPVEKRDGFILNHAAVIFGNLLISIEDSLVNRSFSYKEFCERYNMVIMGTPLEKMDTKGIEDVNLSDSEWSAMIELVNNDKTFADFFENGGRSLPPPIGQTISPVFLAYLDKNILTKYRQYMEPRVKQTRSIVKTT